MNRVIIKQAILSILEEHSPRWLQDYDLERQAKSAGLFAKQDTFRKRANELAKEGKILKISGQCAYCWMPFSFEQDGDGLEKVLGDTK